MRRCGGGRRLVLRPSAWALLACAVVCAAWSPARDCGLADALDTGGDAAPVGTDELEFVEIDSPEALEVMVQNLINEQITEDRRAAEAAKAEAEAKAKADAEAGKDSDQDKDKGKDKDKDKATPPADEAPWERRARLDREKREAERQRRSGGLDYKFSGFGEGSPLHKRALKAARARLAAGVPDSTGLPLLAGSEEGLAGAQQRRALPTPEGVGGGAGRGISGSGSGSGSSSSSSSGEVNAAGSGDAEGGEAGALALAGLRDESVAKLLDEVSHGAIVGTGALPEDPSEWGEMAAASRTRQHPELPASEVTWQLAIEGSEADARVKRRALGGGGAGADADADAAGSKGLVPASGGGGSGDGNGARWVTPKHLDALKEWYTEQGGTMSYVEMDVDDGMRATEDLADGDEVLRMPAKAILSLTSIRHVKSRRGYLKDALAPAFKRDERWGLALLLLHEYYKEVHREGSKWGPLVRSLRARFVSTAVLGQLRGTYAAEQHRLWDDDAKHLEEWMRREHFCLHHDVCQKQEEQLGFGSFQRSELRWALWVVRQNAFAVTKRTTGQSFLALVPFTRLMPHAPGVGGSCTLEMDNTVRVRVGFGGAAGYATPSRWTPEMALEAAAATAAGSGAASGGAGVAAGAAVSYDRGRLTDADTLLGHLWVPRVADSDGDNAVRVALPGVGGTPGGEHDMFWRLDTLRAWRREMHLPARTSDLWRAAEQLHLFGDDEDEWKLLSGTNTRLAGLPVSTDQISAEEQLMMLNGIDAAAAQAQVAAALAAQAKAAGLDDEDGDGGGGGGGAVAVVGAGGRVQAQLYSAPDRDDDPRVGDAMDDLADSIAQLKDAVAASVSQYGPTTDNATATVIEEQRAFLVSGVAPTRGLDNLDLLILRKLALLDSCIDAGVVNATTLAARKKARAKAKEKADRERKGATGMPDIADQLRLNAAAPHVSPSLLCMLRVHLMNETEMEEVCPKAPGAWLEPKCEGGDFNASAPVSPGNERAVLAALGDSVSAWLAGGAEATAADPGRGADDVGGGLLAAARRLRTREAALLRRVSAELQRRERGVELLEARLARERAALSINATNATRAAAAAKAKAEATANATEGGAEEEEAVADADFQLMRRRHEREVQEVRDAALAEATKEARERFEAPRTVVNMSVNVDGQAAIANLTVKEGQSLEHVVLAYAQKHNLGDAAIEALTNAAGARARAFSASLPPVVLTLSVVTPMDGLRRVIAVRGHIDGPEEAAKASAAAEGAPAGDAAAAAAEAGGEAGDNPALERALRATNATGTVRGFCEAHNITDKAAVARLEGVVRTRLGRRIQREVLLRMPVTAMDGQALLLEVRQGDQHDILSMVTDWVLAHRMPADVAEGLATQALRRLPATLLLMPVNVQGRGGGIQLRVLQGDLDLEEWPPADSTPPPAAAADAGGADAGATQAQAAKPQRRMRLYRVVEDFCEDTDMDAHAADQLVRAALGKLNPDALVL